MLLILLRSREITITELRASRKAWKLKTSENLQKNKQKVNFNSQKNEKRTIAVIIKDNGKCVFCYLNLRVAYSFGEYPVSALKVL